MANVNKVSAAGKAMFVHMKATEKINGKDTGKYTLMLALDEAGQKALMDDVRNTWGAFLQTPEMQGRKVRPDWNSGFRVYKDTTYAKFSASAKIKTRSGEVIDINIPIFDGAGNPLQLEKEIGNGSVIKVAYDLYPYYMSQQTHGVSLRLKAVQVLELKTFNGGGASSFGFSTDGAAINPAQVEAVNNAPAVSDENPFPDEDPWAGVPLDDSSGDF